MNKSNRQIQKIYNNDIPQTKHLLLSSQKEDNRDKEDNEEGRVVPPN